MSRLDAGELWPPREPQAPPCPLRSASLHPQLPPPTPQASCQQLTGVPRQPGMGTPLPGPLLSLGCPFDKSQPGSSTEGNVPPGAANPHATGLCYTPFLPLLQLYYCYLHFFLHSGRQAGVSRLLLTVVRLRNEPCSMRYVCN